MALVKKSERGNMVKNTLDKVIEDKAKPTQIEKDFNPKRKSKSSLSDKEIKDGLALYDLTKQVLTLVPVAIHEELMELPKNVPSSLLLRSMLEDFLEKDTAERNKYLNTLQERERSRKQKVESIKKGVR